MGGTDGHPVTLGPLLQWEGKVSVKTKPPGRPKATRRFDQPFRRRNTRSELPIRIDEHAPRAAFGIGSPIDKDRRRVNQFGQENRH